jgi:ribonuclease P protein component
VIVTDEAASPKRYTHPKANRLGGRGTFKAILDHNLRAWRGPVGMAIKPCEAPQSRLGISIGRRVGNAVQRNRIKRLLREAFRLMQHDWPSSHDVVILVKPHEPLALAEYQRAMSHLMVKLCRRPEEP